MADGQPVIIRELEGDRRTLILEGSDVPERGIDVGGTLRKVSTEYPGASRRSTQIMGTSEQPIELRGRFSDTLSGVSGGALDRMHALRRMWLGQRYCELSWGTTLVRRGYIESVTHRIIRDGDIDYKLTFSVDEADEAEVIAVASTPAVSARDTSTAIDKALEVVDAIDTQLAVITAVDAVV